MHILRFCCLTVRNKHVTVETLHLSGCFVVPQRAYLRHHATRWRNSATREILSVAFQQNKRQSASHNNNRPEHSEWRSWLLLSQFKKPSDVLRMRRKRARSEGPDRRKVDEVRPFLTGAAVERTGPSERRREAQKSVRQHREHVQTVPRRERLSHSGALDGRNGGFGRETRGRTCERWEHYWERNCSTLSNKNNTR